MKTSITTAALAAAFVLAGCTGDNDPDPTTSPTTPTASATHTLTETTPTEPTPEASPEEIAAKQAVVDFWKLQDELAADPELGVTRLVEVARGQALEVHRTNLLDQARDGLRQVGSVEVSPTNAAPGPEQDQVIVTACLDVSGVDVVDETGNSVVPAGRPDRAAYDYTVERDGDRWYVIEDLVEAKDC